MKRLISRLASAWRGARASFKDRYAEGFRDGAASAYAATDIVQYLAPAGEPIIDEKRGVLRSVYGRHRQGGEFRLVPTAEHEQLKSDLEAAGEELEAQWEGTQWEADCICCDWSPELRAQIRLALASSPPGHSVAFYGVPISDQLRDKPKCSCDQYENAACSDCEP